MSEDLILVEVAYALPNDQRIIALKVPVGSTLFDVAVKSNIAEYFSDLDLETATMGIFAKIEKSPKTRIIQAGERPTHPVFGLDKGALATYSLLC